jgi:hypothetical protein
LKAVVPVGRVLGAALVIPAASHAAEYRGYGAPPAAGDNEIVLSSRVNIAVHRTERSICKAEEHVDEGEYAKTTVSLRSARRNMYRAQRVAAKQINAVPDPDARRARRADPTR